jgi:ADP-heptose:LPS heptosyltransferase
VDKVLTLKRSLSETLGELRDEWYDYVIDLHNSLRSNRLKARLRVLDFTVKKLNYEKWLLVNFKINRLPALHVVDRYMETVRLFSVRNDNMGLDYFIPEEEEVNLKNLPEPFSSGYAAFAIGAKHFTKKLPPSKIASVCRKIKYPVILLGDKEDEAAGTQIVSDVGNQCMNGCGKFTLHQSASVIRQSRVVVTHDTGLMHIAAAFKKNIISVWGNTVPAFGMEPYMPGAGSEIMEVPGLRCRPCTKIGFRQCPKKHFRCMADQNEDKIAEAVCRLFL